MPGSAGRSPSPAGDTPFALAIGDCDGGHFDDDIVVCNHPPERADRNAGLAGDLRPGARRLQILDELGEEAG
jgi:hypothetical protein